MHSIFRAAALVVTSVAMASSGIAIAQQSAASSDQPAKPVKDPNEIICERQSEVGSRLSSTKVCHTRAEWVALRKDDRDYLDRVQQQRGMQGK